MILLDNDEEGVLALIIYFSAFCGGIYVGKTYFCDCTCCKK